MKDWVRFSVAFWHIFHGTRGDPFGAPTKMWPWEDGMNSLAVAKRRIRANFEFIETLGVDIWSFHHRDIAPDGKIIEVSAYKTVTLLAWLSVILVAHLIEFKMSIVICCLSSLVKII